MRWHKLKNKGKIIPIIEYLISQEREIKVRIEGEETKYFSRILKIMQGFDREDISIPLDKTPELIMEKLAPEEGNTLIQRFPVVDLEFSINNFLCRCPIHYVGISIFYPYYGLMVSFPTFVELQEKRAEERITISFPEYIYALVKVDKDNQKDQLYELNILNCSSHGLGLLITEKDFDLLHIINPGDRISEIILFAESALMHLDGTVRHKTRIKDGEYTGNYLLGIESNTEIKDVYELSYY